MHCSGLEHSELAPLDHMPYQKKCVHYRQTLIHKLCLFYYDTQLYSLLKMLKSLKMLFIYSKATMTKRGRDTERSSITGSLLRWLQHPELGQVEAGGQELHPDLP